MTIGFQCLITIRYGEQGIGWACGDPGGGGARDLDPIGKLYVIWVDIDLNLLPSLTKFPGSAHGGGAQFISLECIRTGVILQLKIINLLQNDLFLHYLHFIQQRLVKKELPNYSSKQNCFMLSIVCSNFDHTTD